MSKQRVRIATRKSPLAMWQAEFIQSKLQQCCPHWEVGLVPMSTEGDERLETALYQVGGKALFIKRLEQAMQAGEADLAVHSLKDIPPQMPPGFEMTAICERQEPRDVFVSEGYPSLESLPDNAVVGTSSLRRQSQLLHAYPTLNIKVLRGNVNTRLAKLAAGEYDGIMLAGVGLQRLGLGHKITQWCEPEQLLPAAGQGALAIECLADSPLKEDLARLLHHDLTDACVRAERAMVGALGGSCRTPIGAYATIEGETIHLAGLVGEPNGKQLLQGTQKGPYQSPEHLGNALAETLLNQGAADLMGSHDA